ncbi:MAG TPA: 3-deoxy-7-phosphoheptulonate synthase [Gemmatimonadaceae bacterium]|nr:3-deoxy-7-phosphoheptulonate synthase [Gemmatimonadaceae bacterium]
MVITTRPGVADQQIDALRERLERCGMRTLAVRRGTRVVVACLDAPGAAENSGDWQEDVNIESVMAWTRPYRLASRDASPGGAHDTTPIRIGSAHDAVVGGNGIVVIAGPCSVEGLEQLRATAHGVRNAGATALRGGALKPRTSPYAFQGMGAEGLELLSLVRQETGLPVVTEVLDTRQVDLVAEHADVLQVGARNMQNYALLAELGRIGRPVLLKRGFAATITELLFAAEHIMTRGNHDVILCERGMRTFESATRFTLDISAIPVLKRETHLPVIVDPSHAAGDAELVPALAWAAIAAGADGLIVEVHARPEQSRSDREQQLSLPAFSAMMRGATTFAAAAGRRLAHGAPTIVEPPLYVSRQAALRRRPVAS